MNEEFAKGKLAAYRTRFTDTSFFRGKTEYPYSQLDDEIRIIQPATPFVQGQARAKVGGKEITIYFNLTERERFASVMEYANEKIRGAKNKTVNYKYCLQAHTGTKLEVYDDYVVLYYVPTRGFMGNILRGGTTGGKRLSFADITSIQFMEPVAATYGFIQFTYPGSGEGKAGVVQAVDDENSIPISKTNLELAREIVEYIEQTRRKIKAGATTVASQLSAADELKKFKELLDMGVITQEEFDAKKKQLLGL